MSQICPIRSMTGQDVECLEKECAWWIEIEPASKRGACMIALLYSRLNGLENAIVNLMRSITKRF